MMGAQQILAGAAVGVCMLSPVYAELPAEPIPNVLELPAKPPPTWVFAHDMKFNSLLDGRVVLVDVASESRNYKGAIDAGMMGSFAIPADRSVLYTTQTFHSRRTYGERTDVLSIFDPATLSPVDEIILPNRRMQVVTQKNAFQLIDDDAMALVMNFTPAASVTVVDLKARTVLQEIPLPACNFVFPTGQRGFSSFCSDGSILTVALDEAGNAKDQWRTEAVIDVDNDPLFVKNAEADGIHYFPTYQGRMQPIDFRKSRPVLGKPWPLVDEELRAANWLPGGWHVVDADNRGRLYVLMHPDGKDGSHKGGGSQVWVYEAASGRLLNRIELKTWGVSIAATHSNPGYIVVSNADMVLDVYEAGGEFVRTISLGMAAHPFVVHAH